ncbi:MAG: crotonase/enoyl-CoA hydratase family protein [SAR86 cluster bacterium]|jgi:enoyl-CoA hydratase|nr:crotonase/enoyl-CoA hydratase family protein [SAR86 cluster bacterium]|tara:strand:+ start:22497 stop:23303 length:807 start_codon:yes stop_codon:yes gene_type:complete
MELSDQHAIIEKKDHILLVQLNRPEKKNALSPDMLINVYDAWRELDEDDNLRCAIITGTKDVFCAGADLTAMYSGDQGSKEIIKRMETVPDLHWQALLRHNRPYKPIIAAVEGFALAGGTEFLHGTDIRVAAETATFGLTEAKRGLFPLGGATVRIRRQIPYTLAAEMLLTGRRITADEAKEYGLIGHVVPEGKSLDKAFELARQIVENSPVAIKAIMKSLRDLGEGIPEEEALKKELELGWPVFESDDSKEGLAAFAEKRTPKFTGK